MKYRNAAFAVATFVAVLVMPAAAGPPDGSKIPASADWICHIDVAAAVNSKIGKYILEHHEEFDFEIGELEAIEDELGIDPLEVILEATVYGDDEERVVALLRTNAGIDDMLREAESREEATVSRIQLGDEEVIMFDDGEFLIHVANTGRDRRMVVISDNADALSAGIAAAHGRSETLGDRLNIEPIEGGLVYLAATDLPVDHDNDDPASMVLRHTTSFSGHVAEQGDDVVIDLRLETGNTEDARNVSDILQGLIALGRVVLAETEDADAKELAEILSSIEVTANDTQIKCMIRQSVEAALKAMKAASEEM